ncbi:MAG: D-glycero-beta-D-manno-heptose-7-phosphate kinase [Bacteroidetes bacterium]|nr:MAG: D-glycero-beta-D-manno-heptose-7-phosphate kinase [Bacteroidota bacterium]
MSNSNQAEQIINRFKDLTVLIIGDIMIDSYLWGVTERVSPEAPVPIVNVTKKEHRMGGAANVALNIKALGATPIICTVIGADEMAMVYSELLRNSEMSDQGVLVSSERVTSQKTRIISHNQQVVRIDEEKIEDLDDKDETRIIERIITLLDSVKPDVIIFEDYNKGVLTKKVINQTLIEANKRNVPSSVDPKKHNFFEYRNATLFKPNLKEFVEGLKLNNPPESIDEWKSGIESLREKLGHRFTFVTLSEQGVLIEENGKVEILPAHLRNIADVSGAGDTVISVASLCLALGTSPELLAELANLAGGLVCEKSGVVPISQNELINELKK